MTKGSETKLKMIDAALDLFHGQGVNATSIDQILEKSGTGKSQFSHYFKNKDGLIREVLAFLSDVVKNGDAPTGYEVNTWKDMEEWFSHYIRYQEMVDFERSCPFGTIGTDLTNEQEVLRQDIRLFMEWSRHKLARFFSERKALGELPPKANPESLADFCITLMQGGMLLTKIRHDPDMFQHASKEALSYLRLLRKQAKA